MDEIKKQKSKKGFVVFLIILGGIVCLNVIGFVVNKVFFSNELKAVAPYGRIVEVDGNKMHVYSMGDGKKTVVLLPGFGVALPCADFGPLMRALSVKYKVVCLEYFGTGFSAAAVLPRINENYMKEIRASLAQAGFKPPYVLMPHSASGIYSEYYASKYPQEVSAIIMLDTTSTGKKVSGNVPKFLYDLGRLQQATGLTRLSYSLAPSSQKVQNSYTAKEISDYKLFAFHVLNDTIIDQSLRMVENINGANEIPFPEKIPVLKLISAQTLKAAGEEYQASHIIRLGPKAQSITIDSSHFIYQTKVTQIYDAAVAFLK